MAPDKTPNKNEKKIPKPIKIMAQAFVVVMIAFNSIFIPSKDKGPTHRKIAWFMLLLLGLLVFRTGYFFFDVMRSKLEVSIYVDKVSAAPSVMNASRIPFYRVQTPQGLMEIRNKKRFMLFRAGALASTLTQSLCFRVQYAPRSILLWRRYPLVISKLRRIKDSKKCHDLKINKQNFHFSLGI